MIPYKEIKKIVRYKLNDNNEISFSDYDIKMAVNEVIRYLSISQALNNSDFLNKGYSFDALRDDTDYRLEGVELPDDFMTLVSVNDHRGKMLEPCVASDFPRRSQYKISGNRLYCGSPSFRMMYKAALHEVDDDEDAIDLPNVFKDTLVQLTTLILQQNDSDIMHTAADDALSELVPKRRYANARIKMPFKI